MATPKVDFTEITDVKQRNAAIAYRHKLEAQRKKASAALKVNEDEIKALDESLIVYLKDSEEERVEIKAGVGVRLTSSTVPTVKDWDAFYAWIKKNNAFFMLERRPSVTGYRDVLASGKAIPGVESFTKIKLNLVS